MLQKISSLTCKCVFYIPKHVRRRPPMELNFEGLEMYTPRVTVIKMSSAENTKKRYL